MTDSRCHRPRVLSQALLLAMLSPLSHWRSRPIRNNSMPSP
ncbi:hypothetical protein [Xanthomonas campestris]|nr:hypothetical protein [Xanthomonas campestris]MEA9654059.1 hypothetical protein [Xanthomonas campestris pv. raphani]